MSLYGALFSGVSGLNSQSNKLGVISDNISNVNTVGYKGAAANFGTLVTSATNTTAYSPGGVQGGNARLIDQQGLLQATNSPTDIAISGSGFFVVNQANDSSGQILYTRAGSFTQDSTGFFKNSAGLFLQAWPLDRDGRLPGEPGNLNTTSSANLSSLQTVNVQNLSGVAASTSNVALGANLDASQTVFPGAGSTATMDLLSTTNFGITASTLILPTTVNSIQRGDVFNINTATGLNYDFKYGGFTQGRNISDGTSTGNGDNGLSLISSPTTLGANPITTVGGGSGDVVITHASHGLAIGDIVSLTGATAVGGITAPQLTGTFLITAVTTNTYTITTAGSDPGAADVGGGAAVVAVTRPFVGNIFDATNATQAFLGTTGTTNYTSAALTFTITTAASGTTTFTYTSASPNTQLGQFNNLNTLASAISAVAGLTARVNNGRLYVGATDANDAVTFANGQSTGVAGPPVQGGLDWIRELGLDDVATGTNRFSTLQGLTDLVNNSAGITATITNPLGASTVEIVVDDPLDTITFSDRAIPADITLSANAYNTTNGSNTVTINASIAGLEVGDVITLAGLAGGPFNGIPIGDLNASHVVTGVNAGSFTIAVATTATGTGAFGAGTETLTPPTNSGSLLGELGITASLNSSAFPTTNPTPTTGSLGPSYDPTDNTKNMAGGVIAAQFSRPATVFDALGAGHNLNIGFIKTAVNTWAVEVYASPASDIASSSNGQVASGTLTFNGDGSLRSVSSGLSTPVSINWSNGAATSTIEFNWGTAGQPFGTVGATTFGKTDGVTQFNTNYNVNFVNQNGAPVGQLVGVSIDENGFIIANYSNGENQRLYKIPLAQFAAPNEMQSVNGNAYAQTASSGVVNLKQPGTSGVGTISAATLEASNVELANQLTDMIVAQRSYSANTKVIQTANQLLEDLDNILR